MKTLSTQQQEDLQKLVQFAGDGDLFATDVRAQFNYWAIELKPKRIRKKIVDTTVEV